MDQVSVSSAYMWAIITMAVFFLLAVLISNMIMYKPNNPGTTSRRIWFWVLCIATGIISYIINYSIGIKITVPSIQSNFYMHAGIAAGVCIVLYISAGFAVSKLFPNAKVGTWF